MIKVGCLMTIFLGLLFPFGSRGSASHGSFNRAFDEYGPMCWEDERARLDNFAIALLHEDRTVIGHILVYDDGKRACRGEAIARAVRAKKYMAERRKVEADRIVWRWGGYLGELTSTLVVAPRGAEIWPFLSSMPFDEVAFAGNCKGKVRPVKCRQWRRGRCCTKEEE